MQPTIESLLNRWIQKLDDGSAKGQKLDFVVATRQVAFDIVGAVAFGQDLGMLSGQNDESVFSPILLTRSTINMAVQVLSRF